MDAEQQPFLSHLAELRQRLLRSVLAILLVFICLTPFAQELFQLFALPLLQNSTLETPMIAIGVVAPFLVPLKLVLLASIFICVPYILYQVWSFVTPGLYGNERRFVLPLLGSSVLLFYTGAAFAYFVFLPLFFDFISLFELDGTQTSPDIALYLDFCGNMFLAFGIAFEAPVLAFLLVSTGLCTAEKLRSMRPWIILAALVAGMLLTPPDVISQLMFALPVWLLFEAGLLASGLLPENSRHQGKPPEPGEQED